MDLHSLAVASASAMETEYMIATPLKRIFGRETWGVMGSRPDATATSAYLAVAAKESIGKHHLLFCFTSNENPWHQE
jgi:hypothetical protein